MLPRLLHGRTGSLLVAVWLLTVFSWAQLGLSRLLFFALGDYPGFEAPFGSSDILD